jgi:hypothetical protein
MEENLTFYVYRGKVKKKEIPRTIRVYERKGYEGFTGRFADYELEKIGYSECYTDCYEVIYRRKGQL